MDREGEKETVKEWRELNVRNYWQTWVLDQQNYFQNHWFVIEPISIQNVGLY